MPRLLTTLLLAALALPLAPPAHAAEPAYAVRGAAGTREVLREGARVGTAVARFGDWILYEGDAIVGVLKLDGPTFQAEDRTGEVLGRAADLASGVARFYARMAATPRPSRLVARHRALHARAVDAVASPGGWRFYDGTLGRPYQLLGTADRGDGDGCVVYDHVGRVIGYVEPDRRGWAVLDPERRRIGGATAHEICCPNGRRHPRTRRKGFAEIPAHAFFGPDAE